MDHHYCHNCGGNYEYRNGRWRCRSCGSYKPEELSNEEVTLLYMAAQKLRLAEFDEAEQAYDDIVQKYPQNPHGYWGHLLAHYGIKYEDDFDGKKIPTCYSTFIESVTSDPYYRKALKYADPETKVYYTQQAEYIERVRKTWVEKAKKEKPYDIFLSYKESDLANGVERTQDSIAAQDLYIHLSEQGYRVFFSRESLRDKTGEKYEPYIFNALSTAKVMLVYGSSAEYITSTWMKNEWTRYEKRIRAGEKDPDSLLVACDGFSPDVLPKTLSSRQCFDASQRRFYSDLDQTIERILRGKKSGERGDGERTYTRKKKRRIGCAATLAALVAFLVGLAISYNTSPSILSYEKNADGTSWYVSGVDVLTSRVEIPATYGGSPVTRIGEGAFQGIWDLESVEIPDSVTEIGDSAFADCLSLTSVTIPSSVTEIGESAFASCAALTAVEIPGSVTKIGERAFYGCRKLSQLTISDGVTEIGPSAFTFCSALTTVSLPESVTVIHDSAFEWCTALASVQMKNDVTAIGNSVFAMCQSLSAVQLSENLKSLGDYAFEDCTQLTSLNLPNSVTKIGYNAFSKSGLTSVVIPAGLTQLSPDSFADCDQLSEITVASGNSMYYSAGNCVIETNGKRLVMGCKNSVIPADGSVTKIAADAFYGCEGMTSLEIPASVIQIADGAFRDCTSLSEITVAPNNEVYHSNGNCIIETASKKLVMGCKNSMIPADGSVTCIGYSAFTACKTLSSVVIPDAVTSLEASAFSYCEELSVVVLSQNITDIGAYAFSGCSKLNSIVFNGTMEQWKQIRKGQEWNDGSAIQSIRCSDGMADVN